MKKTFKTMLALMAGAMVFTACSNDDITENIPQQIPSALKPMTFTASMEGEAGATRAAIDGLDIKWEGTDKISIFDGATENNGDQEFTLTDGDGTTSGTFTGTAAEATTYYALYPYVESKNSSREVTREEAKAAVGDNDLSDDWTFDLVVGHYEDYKDFIESEFSEYGISPENQAIYIAYLKQEPLTVKSGPQRNASDQFENVVLPAAQTATAGSADPNAMLMIGTSTDATTLEFKNVCAYVKVTPSFACSSIVLRSNSTESLAGTMTVGLDTDGNPTTTVTNGTNMVTLSGTIAANGTYCIAVCPATLASGFTVEFKDASDKVLSSKSTAKSVTLTRNKILNLGSFDATPVTTGTAKATIGGSEVDVNWVQLWADGPKFAEYNVEGTMSFTEATKAGAEYVWGANWCTPSKEDMEHLMTAAMGVTDDKVNCEYIQEDGKWGFKFNGLTDGYTDNSVFFPAQLGNSNYGYALYWSATAGGSGAWFMSLYYYYGGWDSSWESSQSDEYRVRPVLKN